MSIPSSVSLNEFQSHGYSCLTPKFYSVVPVEVFGDWTRQCVPGREFKLWDDGDKTSRIKKLFLGT